MTVPVQTPFTETTANGSTTVFPFGFLCLDEEDLEVSKDGAVITTGFTIAGIGILSGGSVTFTVAPANGAAITIALKPVAQREIDYQQSGDWLAASLNRDFDRIWLAIRSLGQSILTSIKLPFSTTVEPIITDSAVARANKYLSFDGDGNLDLTVGPDLEAAIDAQVAAEAAAAIIAGFENKGAWLTATAYAVNNLAQESGTTYICLVAHTSGTFATDYSGGKWAIFAQKGNPGAGTGDLLAANNLSELASTASAARANLGLGSAAIKTASTDGTFAANSDGNLPTEKAAKTYADNLVVNAPTATPDMAADYFMFEDATDNTQKKALLNAIVSASVISAETGELLSPNALSFYTTAKTYSVAHGLSVIPKFFTIALRCTDAAGDYGYSQNDEVLITGGIIGGGTQTGSVWSDATHIGFTTQNTFATSIVGYVANKTTGAIGGITSSKWKFVIRAWK